MTELECSNGADLSTPDLCLSICAECLPASSSVHHENASPLFPLQIVSLDADLPSQAPGGKTSPLGPSDLSCDLCRWRLNTYPGTDNSELLSGRVPPAEDSHDHRHKDCIRHIVRPFYPQSKAVTSSYVLCQAKDVSKRNDTTDAIQHIDCLLPHQIRGRKIAVWVVSVYGGER
jgi:hypothetical protein